MGRRGLFLHETGKQKQTDGAVTGCALHLRIGWVISRELHRTQDAWTRGRGGGADAHG